MTIEELAVKCGAQKRWSQTAISADVIIFTAEQLQAFADEWLALNSSEPSAWQTVPRYEDEEGYFDYTENVDAVKQLESRGWKCIPLFKANPINTAIVDEIKRLREALEVCKYDCNTGEVIGIAEQALNSSLLII